MNDAPQPSDAPIDDRTLKFLRRLVTVLTGTMIVGLLLIFGLLVIRFRDMGPQLPQSITLPSGATAEAFTQGKTWYAVVTEDGRILIYNRSSGNLTQEITLETGE